MDELNKFFKILSDETRLQIIILLYFEELCVCEICGVLQLPQPKVSKHLTKLRDTGLVKDNRNGQYISYRLSIKDETLMNIVKIIVENIDNYPVLKENVKRIKDKDKFLTGCGC